MYIYTMQHSGYGSDKLRLLPMLTNSALYWQEVFLENLKKMIVNLLIDLLGIIRKMQFNLFETRFKCKICGKIFTTKPLLNKHRKEEHNK
jgi:Zinc finger, C2H2 type